MKNIASALAFLVLAFIPVHASATESLTWDHIHLAFPEPHASTEWYIRYLGASARPDGMDGVFFGPIRFNMRKAAPVVSSAGSVIESVGLSYADLDARMRMLDGSGAKVIAAPHTMAGMGRMASGGSLRRSVSDGLGALHCRGPDEPLRRAHHHGAFRRHSRA